MRLRLQSALLLLLLVGFAARPFTAQQSAPTDYTFRSSSDLVLVNITVRDAKGNPVRGLKAEDFTVLEDGKQQKIASFDVQDVAAASVPQLASAAPLSPAVTGAAATAKPAANLPTAPLDARNKRLIVIFFDFTGMQPEEIDRSVSSAQNFIAAQMTAEDVVAVVSFSAALRVDQDFTSDKSLLARAVNRYSTTAGAGYDAGS